jgi:hypothetical protein
VDRAFHVRAIDGKDLELIVRDMPHPAGEIAGLAIGGSSVRIAILPHPGFSSGELLEISYGNPVVVTLIFLEKRAKDVTENRHSQNRTYRAIDEQRYLEKEFSSRIFAWVIHGILQNHCGCGFLRPGSFRWTSTLYYRDFENGWPGNGILCDASHATMSVTFWSVMGFPVTSSRQSGMPSPGKPETTMSRNPWSVISAR